MDFIRNIFKKKAAESPKELPHVEANIKTRNEQQTFTPVPEPKPEKVSFVKEAKTKRKIDALEVLEKIGYYGSGAYTADAIEKIRKVIAKKAAK